MEEASGVLLTRPVILTLCLLVTQSRMRFRVQGLSICFSELALLPMKESDGSEVLRVWDMKDYNDDDDDDNDKDTKI